MTEREGKGRGAAPIPHSRPTLGAAEAEAAARVIRGGRIAQGRETARFEEEFARGIGVAEAVAVSSGTAALHLVLLAMGIGPGHEVIMPSHVCAALLNAARYVGAEAVLADCLPDSGNIDPDDVRRRLTRRTRAVVAPHLFGLPAEMGALLALDVPIIEDCAQTLGTTIAGRPVGGLGRAAIFSFYATKVMTTGEGGMAASSDRGLADRVRDLREYDNRPDDRLRYNYKMTDIQAAMGRAQLGRLDGMIAARRAIAARYDAAAAAAGLGRPPARGAIYYRYVVDGGERADPLMAALRERGIGCARPVFRPLHRVLGRAGYPATERFWLRSMSIPIYPSLSPSEVDRITAALTAK